MKEAHSFVQWVAVGHVLKVDEWVAEEVCKLYPLGWISLEQSGQEISAGVWCLDEGGDLVRQAYTVSLVAKWH